MKKILYTIIVSLLITPTLVFASWWNPFSWFNFSKAKQTSEISITSTDQNDSFSGNVVKVMDKTNPDLEEENAQLKKDLLEAENKKLKKDLANLKSNNNQTVTVPKNQTVKNVTTEQKSEVIVKPTTKTCLNGSIVSVNDFCIKICPDGEQISETLNCRTGSSLSGQSQSINSNCAKSHYTKAQISQQVNISIQTLRTAMINSTDSIRKSYDSQIASLRISQANELTAMSERGVGISSSDVAYKSLVSGYENDIKDLESRKQELISQAESLYYTNVANVQMKGIELDQNSAEVVCGF